MFSSLTSSDIVCLRSTPTMPDSVVCTLAQPTASTSVESAATRCQEETAAEGNFCPTQSLPIATISNRTTTTMPTMLIGAYPQLALYGQVGSTPTRMRMSTIKRITESDILRSSLRGGQQPRDRRVPAGSVPAGWHTDCSGFVGNGAYATRQDSSRDRAISCKES